MREASGGHLEAIFKGTRPAWEFVSCGRGAYFRFFCFGFVFGQTISSLAEEGGLRSFSPIFVNVSCECELCNGGGSQGNGLSD